MKRLSDRPSSMIGLLLLATGVGYVSTAALKGNPSASDPAANLASTASLAPVPDQSIRTDLSEGTVVEVDAAYQCRRVIGDGLSLYSALFATNQPVTTLRTFNNGDRVGLVDRTARVGFDGDLFVQVTAPYNSSNAQTGYIRARGSDQRGSLGLCSNPNPPPYPPLYPLW